MPQEYGNGGTTGDVPDIAYENRCNEEGCNESHQVGESLEMTQNAVCRRTGIAGQVPGMRKVMDALGTFRMIDSPCRMPMQGRSQQCRQENCQQQDGYMSPFPIHNMQI